MRKILFIFLLCIVGWGYTAHAQCVGCPIIAVDVDLRASPNMEWLSPIIPRDPVQCCTPPSATARCVRFNVYTHPDAQLLNFEIYQGASPPGHSYSLNCGGWVPMGTPVCLSGPGPHCVLVCKPGGNENSFRITQSKAADISPPITIGEGCQDTIWVSGLVPSTIQWTIVNPGSAYNSYLSATSGVEEIYVASPPVTSGIPFFDVEVSGEIQGVCSGVYFKDTVRINLVSNKGLDILPADPVICFGGAPISLTAVPTGGQPPYRYLWNTGATTQSIMVGLGGDYKVQVWDATDCPVIADSTFVKTFQLPISVDAGNGNVCLSSPAISLAGSVVEAQGGIWSGGGGTYNPSNTALNATYTLSAAELAAKSATLTLTSTGNWGCPAATDQLTITVSPLPFVNAGTDGMVCASTMSIPLNGQVWGDATNGIWSTLGTGSFADPTNLTGPYLPSAADISLGYVDLVLSSIANGLCLPVKDTVRIFFGNEPIPNFTFPQPACSGKPIQFSDLSTVGWGIIDTWQWNFGNSATSNSKNPTSVYITPGTYTVQLQVTSDKGCTTSISKNITISPDPVANFISSQTCFGQAMNFTDQSTNAALWQWTFNNGTLSTSQNPTGVMYPYAEDFDVTLTVTSAAGCMNTVVKPVTVLPKPNAEFSVGTICVSNPITFQNYATVNNDVITSWQWDLGNGNTSLLPNPTTTYSSIIPVNVRLIVSTATCSDTVIKPITPRALPIVTNLSSSGCTPYQKTFAFTPEANTVYYWNFGDGGYATSTNPTHVFINNTAATTVYNVKTIAQNSYSCKDSIVSNITVFPVAVANFNLSASTICSGQTLNLINTSQNAVSYAWDFGDGATSTAQHPNHVYINATTQPITYSITLTVTSGDNCTNTIVKNVIVFPLPNNTITLNTGAACHPALITFQTESGAQLYNWNFGDGNSIQGSNFVSHTYSNPGLSDVNFTVNLTVTSLQGCVNTFQRIITVYASPIADFTLVNDRGCAPLLIDIQNNSFNSSIFSWTFGDGTSSSSNTPLISHTYQNTTAALIENTIELEVTSPSGCTDEMTQKVFVYPEVDVNFILNPASGCNPLTVSFTNQSVRTNSYIWSFGDGYTSPLTNPTHTFSNDVYTPKTYTVRLTGSSNYGCVDSAQNIVTVNALALATFTMSASQICTNQSISFTNQSVNGVSYAWNFGDGATSTLQHPSHVFLNTSNLVVVYPVTLTITSGNGCTNTIVKNVTVNPLPNNTITVDKAAACHPAVITFHTETGAQSYFWNFGDGFSTTGSNVMSHTYNNPGTTELSYNVVLTVTSTAGCVNTFNQTVAAYPPSHASFSAPNICYESTVDFTDLSTNVATWYWVFNNGTSSTDQNPQNIYYSYAGTFNVSLTATSGRGCESTVVNQITVYPKPVAQFSVGTICEQNPITFQDNSNVNNDNIITWSWNFGDGTTSSMPNPTTTYYITNPVNASLIVSTAHCADTIIRQVEPHAIPNLTQINSAGCSPNQVNFNFPIEPNVVYTWNFGDGEFATTPNPTHVFVNASTSQVTYNVKVVAENNYTCRDSISSIAVVYPNVVADYSLSAVKVCSNQQVDFTNNSVNAIGYNWDFGDGTTSTVQNPSHVFINTTNQNIFYAVTLISTSANLCKDTVVKYVTVNPAPNSSFTFNDDAACHPALITMQAEMGAQIYFWDFGDGYSTSGSHLMTHTFNNTGLTDQTYTVSLTVTSMDGCIATFTDDMLVYASPIAEFTLPNDRGCAPLDVSIQNSSYNGSVFTWSFGDGQSSNSNLATISHSYQNTTTILKEFTIDLHVVSASGCVDDISKKVFVYPQITVDFSLAPPNGCSPFTVDFTNSSVNTSSNLWIFGDGQTSAQVNPTHVFSNDTFSPKTLAVRLIGSTGYGCVDSAENIVVVNPLVDADFTTSSSKICSNETVTFTSQSINALSYSWDFGDGTSKSFVQNPSHVFVNTGATTVYYPVTLLVTSQNGCIDSITKFITVYPIPNFPIQVSEDSSCGPAIVTITTNPGAQLYNWDFGDGTTTYGSEQMVHSFQNTSLVTVTYTINLTITTLQGCVSTSDAQVTVFASPVADFDISKTVGCAPVEVTIDNNSLNVSQYTWDFGDETQSNSTAAQLVHEYQNTSLDEVVFEIGLYVRSISGCTDTLIKEVSVYPFLDIDVSPSVTSGCSPVRVDFTNNSAGTDFYDWDFGDGKNSYDRAPSHIFLNNSYVSQQFTVQYIGSSIYGCADTTSFQISVDPLVRADFELSASEICSGDTILFENTSVNGSTFNWNFGNGQTSTAVNPQMIFQNTASTVQYYAITLVVNSLEGCSDTIVKYVTVNPLPSNILNLSTTEACHPADITVSTASGGRTYYWDFGDGTFQYGANSVQHLFMNQTTADRDFTVTLHYTSMQGCEGVFTNTVKVFPSPVANFVTNVQIGCSPLEVTFTNNSEREIESRWTMLDETFIKNDASFIQSFFNSGTSQISYPTSLQVTSSNGCTATQELTINVYPPLQADFTPSKTLGCSPLEVNFTNLTIGGTSYRWEYGDGNNSSNFNTQHVFINETSTQQINDVYIIARSAFNCVDTSQVIPITVNPKPFADFTLSTISGCSPFDIDISNRSTGASMYEWDLGDGTISYDYELNSHEYHNSTDTLERYLLKLSATNMYGCVDTSLQPISVFPEVLAVFDCPTEGCTPFEMVFTNTSSNATDYLWDFGNSRQSSIAEPDVYFVNNTEGDVYYIVELEASSTYGCSGSSSKSILVHPSPRPDFSTSASYLRIPESTISVTNLTEGDWTYLWEFGDGAKTDIEDPNPHTYNTAGEYQIILKASSPYCWDTISHFITIAGARVYADYDSSMFGCVPFTVTFTNKSRNAEWYIWNFGNGDTSTAVNPTYTYTEPGTFVVELTAGNEDVQDVSRAHTISVYDLPVSDFEIAPEYSYLPHAEITTFNKSKNGYTYVWYFGDGDTSHVYQPTHEYTEVGTYDIALAITSREGCYDSLMIPQAAKVLLDCKLLFPNAFTPIGAPSDGYYNPDLPEVTNDIFHPVWQNIIEYNLQIFNRWGEIVYETNELERGWNGYYKDKLSKSDVYVWRSEATCWGGKKLTLRGNVTLLR